MQVIILIRPSYIFDFINICFLNNSLSSFKFCNNNSDSDANQASKIELRSRELNPETIITAI